MEAGIKNERHGMYCRTFPAVKKAGYARRTKTLQREKETGRQKDNRSADRLAER